MHFLCILAGCVMAELPSGLLEACVVVGASSDKLRDIYQACIYSIHSRKDRSKTRCSIYILHSSCVNKDSTLYKRFSYIRQIWINETFLHTPCVLLAVTTVQTTAMRFLLNFCFCTRAVNLNNKNSRRMLMTCFAWYLTDNTHSANDIPYVIKHTTNN